MKDEPRKPQRMKVHLAPEVAQGEYANAVHISVTPGEFLIDFARALPGLKGIEVHSRLILPPLAAKGLARKLEQAVAGYETKFGVINDPGRPEPPPFNFDAFDGNPEE
ncbi:DUF3467 domain-containing protein [bacterium]|nr:DUF3467 domain-containing protein [bacterium]